MNLVNPQNFSVTGKRGAGYIFILPNDRTIFPLKRIIVLYWGGNCHFEIDIKIDWIVVKREKESLIILPWFDNERLIKFKRILILTIKIQLYIPFLNFPFKSNKVNRAHINRIERPYWPFPIRSRLYTSELKLEWFVRITQSLSLSEIHCTWLTYNYMGSTWFREYLLRFDDIRSIRL